MRGLLLLPAAASAAAVGTNSTRAAALQSYNIDTSSMTVSGLSAGGFFAVQMHVAFSDAFQGAAVAAGGPYYCAQGQLTNALTGCMATGSVSLGPLESYAKGQQGSGIDSLDNLKDDKVVLFCGTQDRTVVPAVTRHLETQYKDFGVADVAAELGYAAGHGWPTDFTGNACGTTGSPWIVNCGYDFAGDILKKWYGDLSERAPAVVDAHMQQFDQREFGTSGTSLDNTGYIYVPEACQKGELCKLHFNFHGCQQGRSRLGDKYVKFTGLNRWAETNRIIVVYPQSDSSMISNPNGCLDWWGYDGAAYALKSGKQMKVMKAILDRLTDGKPPGPPPATPSPTQPSTPQPAPTPAPSPCVLTTGYNNGGQPLGSPSTVESADECCALCVARQGCVGFSFGPSGVCTPKSALGALEPEEGVTAGEVASQTPAPPPPTTPAPATPAPQPPSTPAPPPADCSSLPGGTTCLTDTSYIICPVNLVENCVVGTCHQMSPGVSFCA